MSFKYKQSVSPILTSLTLSSERLKLRPVCLDDVEPIFLLFNRNITRFMVPEPFSQSSETKQFIYNSIKVMQENRGVVMTILGSDNEFMGICAIQANDKPHTPELGIWVKEAQHSKGIGFEAMQTLFEWAKAELLADYFIYPVSKINTPSRKLVEKLGGVKARNRLIKKASGQFLDEVVYHLN